MNAVHPEPQIRIETFGDGQGPVDRVRVTITDGGQRMTFDLSPKSARAVADGIMTCVVALGGWRQ